MLTPILVVILAIGTTDLVFALDSIPAVFGITQDPFLVFSANLFALMGLRQLYFLLGHLIDRLAYLTYGITVILVFIAVKLCFMPSTTTTSFSSTAANRSPGRPRSARSLRSQSSRWRSWHRSARA